MKLSKESIKKFLNLIPPNTPKEELEDHWLDDLTYSQALVVCIGAGPWKEKRRQQVQRQALDMLEDHDITQIPWPLPKHEKWYPFDWQNDMLGKISRIFQYSHRIFNEWCNLRKKDCENSPTAIKTFWRFEFLKAIEYEKKVPKVLSLFIRDKLGFPSFPLDRHVKRILDDCDIPHDETLILNLCLRNGINPSQLNRYIFHQKSSNPDWRTKLVEIM